MIAKDGSAVLECFKMNFETTIGKNHRNAKRRSKHVYKHRQRRTNIYDKKKTHVLRFMMSQRKNKKPVPMDPATLEGPTLLRFGTTAGTRDERPTRCPLRGIHHTATTASKTCTCTHYSLIPTPLHQVKKPVVTTYNMPVIKQKPEPSKRIPLTKLCLA